jgi:wyosine [tRNA(Phe)-imidazoG37] synthetase (radical SAM superfamily)
MKEPDFRARRPQPEETTSTYAARLEAEGHEEMFIRKGLAHHFNMGVDEMGEFFEKFREARLRHIELLSEMHPNRTEYSLIVKVSRNLGISREDAERWVHAFRQAGETKP